MRTTLELDAALIRTAEKQAEATGRTLSELVEAALREMLRLKVVAGEYAFEWRPVAGGGRARVDLDDRDTLWTRMEGSE